MRRTPPLPFKHVFSLHENIVQIRNGTFYSQHPSAALDHSSSVKPPLYSNLTFELPAEQSQQHWAVVGTSGVKTLLEILQGKHICIPPTARTFPYLSQEKTKRQAPGHRTPSKAIQYVGFNGGTSQGQDSGIKGAYLSARYESHREESDWTVLQYLRGETDLNPTEEQEGTDSKDAALLAKVIRDLRMEKLVTMPVSNLSNGQTRRARVARALLGKPELLLLDEPFMGLDPPMQVTLSSILRELAYTASPRILLGFRPQDPVPDWITHLIVLGTNQTIALMGEKVDVLFKLHRWVDNYELNDAHSKSLAVTMAKVMTKYHGPPFKEVNHILTSDGIITYDAYDAAKSAKDPPVFWNAGHMNESVLDANSRQRLKSALSTIQKHEPSWSQFPHRLENCESALTSALLDATALVPSSAGSRRHNSDAISKHPFTRNEAQSKRASKDPAMQKPSRIKELGKPLVELSSVVIKYGEKTVLGYPPSQKGYSDPGLNLAIRQGTRLALLGPNGSGKTTLLSLLTSDHPHSYSLPIKFFGRSRLPSVGTAGLSIFEIQSRIGHSSPEIHAFFPNNLTIRQTLESAWAETFSAKPKLTYAADEMVDVFLNWWEPELKPTNLDSASLDTSETPTPTIKTYVPPNYQSQLLVRRRAMYRLMEDCVPCPIYPGAPWFSLPLDGDTQHQPLNNLDWAEITRFHDLPFGAQRLLLLLRAMVKQPDILVLDEAFSGLTPGVRDKAMLWLESGQTRFRMRKQISKGRIPRHELRVMENQRHVFDAMCRKLDLREEEVMERWLMTKPGVPALRAVREIRQDEELQRVAEGWDVDMEKTYRFRGLKDTQAMVVVSHIKEEIPGMVDQWIRLPSEEEVVEAGRGVEMGDCANGEIRTVEGWNRVWGLKKTRDIDAC